MPFVYIIKCSDETLYTGYAVDLDERIKQHNLGKGAKYTRGRLPVTLCYHETYASVSEAMQRENEIKKLTRKQKFRLIEKV